MLNAFSALSLWQVTFISLSAILSDILLSIILLVVILLNVFLIVHGHYGKYHSADCGCAVDSSSDCCYAEYHILLTVVMLCDSA
jgi:hypothetical protein